MTTGRPKLPGLLLAAAVLAAWAPAHAADPCADRGTSIVVRTLEHMLFRCEDGRTAASHLVSLGRGGLGKTRQGDGKTPLGTYRLGKPRGSAKFWTFVPVAYPTPEQRRLGFTGSAIGVHGPSKRWSKRLSWLSSLGRIIDWTQGCIAVATRAEIDEIAAWIRRKKPVAIHLE